MGRSCHEDEILEEDQEEEEEEALSLCDLPLKQNHHPLILNQNPIRSSPPAVVQTEDFDFNHWPPLPMCAADDVFFRGHMLPLRLSFGSENTHNHFFSKNLSSRSESMDHNMLRFRNGSSSSSSSSNNHYSRSSSISNNSISIPTNSKPRPQKNVFHSHPSPTPQLRSLSTSGHRSRRSSRWDFFRLGLLRTPGMELHDLKTRTNTTTATATAAQKPTGSFLGVVSCKKSVDTILPPPPRSNGIREKVMGELKMMRRVQKQKVLNNNNVEINEKENEKETRLSHRRTFEWLKQLSHASFADEQ